MNKASSLLFVLTVFMLAGNLAPNLVKADQFYPTQNPPSIVVESPNSNIIYKGFLELTLNFTINYLTKDYNAYIAWNNLMWVEYSVDGGPLIPIQHATYVTVGLPNPFNATVNVAGLVDGLHSIQINAGFTYCVAYTAIRDYVYSFDPINFTIYNHSPIISNLSLKDQNYTETSLPFNFTINRQNSWISWMGYSLDNQANITIAGNSTLTGLSDGSHNIVVYANDTAGNVGKSDIIFFTVNTQPSPTPSPTQA